MNYKETLDFLYSKLPIYQRTGEAAYKKDTKNKLQRYLIVLEMNGEVKDPLNENKKPKNN